MKIPDIISKVSGVRFHQGRLHAPEQADQSVKDVVTLANRELEASEKLRREVLALDGTSADQDLRPGVVSVSDYNSKTLKGKLFSVVADEKTGTLLARFKIEQHNHFLDRQIGPGELKASSRTGSPGPVPGFEFSIRLEQGKDSGTLNTSFSRFDMADRMSKEDIQDYLSQVPESEGINKEYLSKALGRAKGQDYNGLYREFSSAARNALETDVRMLSAGTVYLGAVGWTSFGLASAGHVGLAVGAFVAGLGGIFLASEWLQHKFHSNFEVQSYLGRMHHWVFASATEMPKSFVTPKI